MRIPDDCLNRLRGAGLLVSRAFPDRVFVAKPKDVGGNSIPGYELFCGPEEIVADAPAVCFHNEHGKWIVTSHDYVPGPGPGDFVDEWTTAEDATEDILDFYFGDPSRMLAKPRGSSSA